MKYLGCAYYPEYWGMKKLFSMPENGVVKLKHYDVCILRDV